MAHKGGYRIQRRGEVLRMDAIIKGKQTDSYLD
jgi:hypothetical protein